MKKIKVYSVWCDYTDLHGIQTHDLNAVKDIIEGDIAEVSDLEVTQVGYKIKVDLMSKKHYENLPDYQP